MPMMTSTWSSGSKATRPNPCIGMKEFFFHLIFYERGSVFKTHHFLCNLQMDLIRWPVILLDLKGMSGTKPLLSGPVYIYVCVWRERERKIIYIFIYTSINTLFLSLSSLSFYIYTHTHTHIYIDINIERE